MSETQESKSFFRKHWEGYKEFWAERFSFLDNYSRFINPDKPCPIGIALLSKNSLHLIPSMAPLEAAKFGAVGAAVGAVSTAGCAWKWSRSPHGAALSFAFGAVVGGTFGLEIANHWYQLYRLDPMASQVKFFEWLQKRA
ncbi:hypothetical protein Pfo_007450 [Paulownia fortunei]|nr:hypothetical protein Pfo_007450 [Paulownia fortunei]